MGNYNLPRVCGWERIIFLGSADDQRFARTVSESATSYTQICQRMINNNPVGGRLELYDSTLVPNQGIRAVLP